MSELLKKSAKAEQKEEIKKADSEVKAEKKADKIELVKMKRGDVFADVHPDEVINYAGFGWIKE